jgi:hypothetical protein
MVHAGSATPHQMSHYPPTYVHWFPPKIRIDVNKPFKIKPSAPFSCSGKRSRNDLYDSIISINAVAGIASQFEPSFSPWPYSLFSPQNLASTLTAFGGPTGIPLTIRFAYHVRVCGVSPAPSALNPKWASSIPLPMSTS